MTTKNIQFKPAVPITPPISAGQWYRDISKSGNNRLYVIANLCGQYVAVNINTGNYYVPPSVLSLVFGSDRKDFVLINEVDITIH
jgi:hypothetical protein